MIHHPVPQWAGLLILVRDRSQILINVNKKDRLSVNETAIGRIKKFKDASLFKSVAYGGLLGTNMIQL